MAISRFLDPKNDFAFKKVFGTEGNKEILIHFLNDIVDLPYPIDTVSFLSPSLDPEIASKKQSIVDVLCTDSMGIRYIIEMQVAHSAAFVKRAQYYAAKTYCNELIQGDQYESLRQVIFIAITDFVMFPATERYKSNHVILDAESYAHELKDFSFTFLELPKFTKKAHELSNITDKWLYFFKHALETQPAELSLIVGKDLVIQKAYEAVNSFYWSDTEALSYEQSQKSALDHKNILLQAEKTGIEKGKIEGEKIGIEKGKAEGKAEGKIQAQLECARKLLDAGIPIEQVASLTDLSIEHIRELAVDQAVVADLSV